MRANPPQRGPLLVTAFAALVIGVFGGLTIKSASAFNEAEQSSMRQQLVAKFCEQTEWLRCFGEQPSKCSDVVGRFVKPCIEQHLGSRDGPIVDPAEARGIALSVIQCFNTEFATTHPMGKSKSPECANAPAHLQ